MTAAAAIGMTMVMACLVVGGCRGEHNALWWHGWPLVWQYRYCYLRADAEIRPGGSELSGPLPFLDEAPTLVFVNQTPAPGTHWDYLLCDVLIAGALIAIVVVGVFRLMRTFHPRLRFSIRALLAVTAWLATAAWLAGGEDLAAPHLLHGLAIGVAYLAIGVCWFQTLEAGAWLLNRLKAAGRSRLHPERSALKPEQEDGEETKGIDSGSRPEQMHRLDPRIGVTTAATVGMTVVMASLVVWSYTEQESFTWRHGWPLIWQVRLCYPGDNWFGEGRGAPSGPLPSLVVPPAYLDKTQASGTHWGFLLVDVLIAGILIASVAIGVHRLMRMFHARPRFTIRMLLVAIAWLATVAWLARREVLEPNRLLFALTLVIAYLAIGVFLFQAVDAGAWLLSRLHAADSPQEIPQRMKHSPAEPDQACKESEQPDAV